MMKQVSANKFGSFSMALSTVARDVRSLVAATSMKQSGTLPKGQLT